MWAASRRNTFSFSTQPATEHHSHSHWPSWNKATMESNCLRKMGLSTWECSNEVKKWAPRWDVHFRSSLFRSFTSPGQHAPHILCRTRKLPNTSQSAWLKPLSSWLASGDEKYTSLYRTDGLRVRENVHMIARSSVAGVVDSWIDSVYIAQQSAGRVLGSNGLAMIFYCLNWWPFATLLHGFT